MELLCYQLLPHAHPDHSVSVQAQLGGLSSPFSCSLAGDLAGPADTCDVPTCSVHAAASPQRPSDPPQPSRLQLPRGQRPQARALGPVGDMATVLQTGSLDGVTGAVTQGPLTLVECSLIATLTFLRIRNNGPHLFTLH